jgi:hypothetical protein
VAKHAFELKAAYQEDGDTPFEGGSVMDADGGTVDLKQLLDDGNGVILVEDDRLARQIDGLSPFKPTAIKQAEAQVARPSEESVGAPSGEPVGAPSGESAGTPVNDGLEEQPLAELRAEAARRNLDVGRHANKDELVAALRN